MVLLEKNFDSDKDSKMKLEELPIIDKEEDTNFKSIITKVVKI